MASAVEPRPSNTADAPQEAERLVDKRIQRVRRGLKVVDLAAGILGLVIGVLSFLLAAAAVEHWIVPGGWSTTARGILFLLLLLGVGWFSWRTFWPLLHQPINPAYAALAIEQHSPSLKNSLLNFLLLRSRRQHLSRQVFQAIELQAAQRLSKIPLDSVVDRSAILRLGYVLLAVAALGAVYYLLSPKDTIASAARVLMPWSSIPAPSRVQINDVSPGDTSAARGEQLKISAEVLRLAEGEQVRLYYSTADQQIVRQELLMTVSTDGSRHQCQLPGRNAHGDPGVQQDLTYWIEAGDARSPRYQLSVFARPTLVVQHVRYNYPDYTGYPSREEEHTGDLHAVEGTVVTLTALANQAIDKAHVDFEADGRHDNLMKVEDRQASVSFPLELRDDRRTPRYQSYVLRYTTTDGKKNQLPPKYRIDVTPDYAPEIRLVEPAEDTIDVALDEQVTIRVEARDPDFAVRSVALFGEVAGKQVLKEVLLSKDFSGRFVGQTRFTPHELQLQVGDVLEYWGGAADNRQPDANLAFTDHRKIRVVGPTEGDGQQTSQNDGDGQQQPGEDRPQDGQQDSTDDQGENQGEDSQENQGEGEPGQEGGGQDSAGESGADDQQQSQGGGEQSADGEGESQNQPQGTSGDDSPDQQQPDGADESNEGSDGGSGGGQQRVSPEGDDDGAAFERIDEHFQEQQGDRQGEPGKPQPTDGAASEGQQPTSNDSRAADGSPDTNQSGQGADGEGAENGEDSQGNGGEKQDRRAEGPGAEGEPAPPQDEQNGPQGEESQQEQAPGGQMSPEQGPPGAGQNPGQNQGSPDSSADRNPRDKQGDSPTGAPQNDSEPAAQGEGQTESDSRGSQGGDRAGGGQEGAGQQADADGTGAAGQNQAADDGAGQSREQGDGEAGSQPGGNQQADGQTGESSQNQPGNGSQQSDQPGGQPGGENQSGAGEQQPGGAQGEQQPADGQQPADSKPGDGQSASAAAGQQPSGGGAGGESTPPPPGQIQPGDEANLDYARKKTDLIVEKLEDQLAQKQVDEGLLEKLGWNEDELRRFVDRWKNLTNQAEDRPGSTTAQQELAAALRSLGLSPNRRTRFRAKTAQDKLRDLRDDYRGRTPLRYQEQLRAYVKGTATAEEEK